MVSALPLRLSAVAWGVVVLAACGGPPEPPRPISWYQAHPQELDEKVTWCRQSESRRDTPDCRNALVADWHKHMGPTTDAAPLNWNQPNSKQEP